MPLSLPRRARLQREIGQDFYYTGKRVLDGAHMVFWHVGDDGIDDADA